MSALTPFNRYLLAVCLYGLPVTFFYSWIMKIFLELCAQILTRGQNNDTTTKQQRQDTSSKTTVKAG